MKIKGSPFLSSYCILTENIIEFNIFVSDLKQHSPLYPHLYYMKQPNPNNPTREEMWAKQHLSASEIDYQNMGIRQTDAPPNVEIESELHICR